MRNKYVVYKTFLIKKAALKIKYNTFLLEFFRLCKTSFDLYSGSP